MRFRGCWSSAPRNARKAAIGDVRDQRICRSYWRSANGPAAAPSRQGRNCRPPGHRLQIALSAAGHAISAVIYVVTQSGGGGLDGGEEGDLRAYGQRGPACYPGRFGERSSGCGGRPSGEAYIRRVIKPALGHLQVRKIRGPLLHLLYAQLRRCSDPGCSGKRFVEHRNVPTLSVVSASRRPAWQQVADTLRGAVNSGMLAAGDPLSSVQEISALQGVRVATLQHALAVLAEEGLVVLRQGRTAVVAGDVVVDRRARAARGRDHDCKRAGCQPHVCRPLTAKTIRNIHSILSGAFSTAERWEWISWNPAESAMPATVTRRPVPATAPEDVAKVIAESRKTHPAMALHLWLVAITGARRGELCALQVCDVDLENGVLHLAYNYVVVGGRRVRKDTKTHQDRYLAIDPVTCTMLREHLQAIRAELGGLGLELPEDAYVFSNDPMGASPWNPDWATHKASDLAAAAGVKLNIKGLRHYTASQLLAARFDLRNTAARLGHGSGGATALRHYADPVSEVDRRAAAYLAALTACDAGGATT